MSLSLLPRKIITPSADSDAIVNVFLSPSGRFAAAMTESTLSVISFRNLEPIVLESIDVSDILANAGAEFEIIEGTLSEAVWSPDESIVFVSTIEGIVEGIRVVTTPLSSDEYIVNYQLVLDTVLVLPVKEFVLAPSKKSLIIVSKETRILYLIDWKNYKTRAQRCLLPSLNDSTSPQSPCIQSVLPLEVDETKLKPEPFRVVSACVSDDADTLLVLYENGMIRSFALSTAPIHGDAMINGTVPSVPGNSMRILGNKLAISSCSDLYVYDVHSPQQFSQMIQIACPGTIESFAWSSNGFLFITHSEGLSVHDGQSTFILHHETRGLKQIQLSISHKMILLTRRDSPYIEMIPLAVSSSLLTKCSSLNQSLLFISRDAIRIGLVPYRQLRYVPLPFTFTQENGPIKDGYLQVNQTSRFVLILGSAKGFALWSNYSSSMASQAKQEGKWELLASRIQEEEVDFGGFLSETVFFTRSNKIIKLWSVLKRIDPNYILSTHELPHEDVEFASADPDQGVLAIVYGKSKRMDILKLVSDKQASSYKLQLVASLPSEFPSDLKQFIVVSSPRPEISTVLGLTHGGNVLTRTGERVAGNISSMFWSVDFGYDEETGDFVPPKPAPAAEELDLSGGDEDSVNSDDSGTADDTMFTDRIESEDVSPKMFFIGDNKTCAECHNIQTRRFSRKKIVKLIQKKNPVLWMISNSTMSLWVMNGNRPYCGRPEFVARHDSSGSPSVVSVSSKYGVLASLSDISSGLCYQSAMNVLLMNSGCPIDSFFIFSRLKNSPFFSNISEVWLHCILEKCLPVLSKLEAPFDLVSVEAQILCNHAPVRQVIEQLLGCVWVIEHFPSVSTSCFAAAIRKTEPQITFPIATSGSLNGRLCEDMFRESVGRGKLQDAGLLLVIIQERIGPVLVREHYAIPLFRESLLVQDYTLARDISGFYFSYSKHIRESLWTPASVPDQSSDQYLELSLRINMDTIVLTHLNHLVNESMNWVNLIRFSESLQLNLGDWLSVVPRHEYLDFEQLVSGFKIMINDEVCYSVLAKAFKKAQWLTHLRAIAIASDYRQDLDEYEAEIKMANN
jgi:hypothetical protein